MMGCFFSCFRIRNHQEITNTSPDQRSIRSDDHSFASDDNFFHCVTVSEGPSPPSITTAAESETDETNLVDEVPVYHGVNLTDSGSKGPKENHWLFEKIQTGDQPSDQEECDSLEDENFCPICFEEYTQDNPKILTQCSHGYHLGCMLDWMERSANCPFCYEVTLIENWIAS